MLKVSCKIRNSRKISYPLIVVYTKVSTTLLEVLNRDVGMYEMQLCHWHSDRVGAMRARPPLGTYSVTQSSATCNKTLFSNKNWQENFGEGTALSPDPSLIERRHSTFKYPLHIYS